MRRTDTKSQILHLIKENRTNEALEKSSRYCEANPDDPEGWLLRGSIHDHEGNLKQAELCYHCAIEKDPMVANSHYCLGSALLRRGNTDEAAACLKNALELNPDHVAANFYLGNVLFQGNRTEEAIHCYRHAIDSAPSFTDARLNLAVALIRQSNVESAASELSTILTARPEHIQANVLMGDCMSALDSPAAVKYYQCAAQAGADAVSINIKLGQALQSQYRIEEAMTAFDNALAKQSECADARVLKSLTLLLLGEYRQGWQEYEWRWKLPTRTMPKLDRPLWNGASLKDRTILLHPEQGIGDSIQFLRFATILREHGARVLFMPPPRLFKLAHCFAGIDNVLRSDEPLPPYDFHLPLMSLPFILNTEVETIPADIPYIFIDEPLKPELDGLIKKQEGKFRVGVVWAGGITAKNDHLRSCPVSQVIRLGILPEVALFSLQKGQRSAQLETADTDGTVTDLAPFLNDFVDTAAVMNELDLIISVDTATAHLAGALGRPVWTVLAKVPDWRWLLDRDDSPWYPTMVLFRQNQAGDWDDLFDRVLERLTVAVNKQLAR